MMMAYVLLAVASSCLACFSICSAQNMQLEIKDAKQGYVPVSERKQYVAERWRGFVAYWALSFIALTTFIYATTKIIGG